MQAPTPSSSRVTPTAVISGVASTALITGCRIVSGRYAANVIPASTRAARTFSTASMSCRYSTRLGPAVCM